MSHPGYPPPPPGWEPQPPKRTNWAAYVLGAIFGAPAVGALVGGFDALVTSVSSRAGGVVGILSLLLLIGIPVGLIVPERTRPWGIGILIGFALWAIIAAGACVILFAVLVNGENSH
ncbi:MAG TPA: hypothetical protein VN088_10780 [Nocardioides sp.]|nr:hypothetical protein [Nocardioides sp.]